MKARGDLSLSIRILKLSPWPNLAAAILVGALSLLFGWYFVKWNFATLVAHGLDPANPQMRSIAEWLATIDPNDPQTHVLLAAFLERTFDAGDLEQSLVEYDNAARLAPDNYLVWLELAKARDRHGDVEESELAFNRALELAPNYSSVQWAAGNAFIRHKKMDQGFALIAKAAAGNATFAESGTALVFQLYDDDAGAVKRLLGNSAPVNNALSRVLMSRQRYDEAVDAWRQIPPEDRRDMYRELSNQFIAQLLASKQVRAAMTAYADVATGDDDRPAVAKILNGGFESGIKLKGAGPFQWHIGEGAQPLIGLTDAQKHSGQYALIMNFNSFESVAFRTLEQTVPVDPGRTYSLEVFYKAEMKTPAEFRWEITDIGTGAVIGKTPDLVNADDWTPLNARFTTGAKSDGIIVRIVREGCYGPICPSNGKIVFDDVGLRQE